MLPVTLWLKGRPVLPSSGDQGYVNVEVLLRPSIKLLVKVFCSIGKSGKNKDFTVRLALLINRGLSDLGGDDFLQFRQLDVPLRGYIVRLKVKTIQLLFVLVESFEPSTHIKMGGLIGQLFANLHGISQFLVLQFLRGKGFQVKVGILLPVLLKGLETVLQ